MAQRASITLTDATPVTPVNRVYNPSNENGDGQLNWRDSTQSILTGQNRLALVQRMATRQTRATKFYFKLETPILAQTSPSTTTGIQPAPTVSHTPLGEIIFVLPEQSTAQERKDLLAQMRDLIDEAIVTNLVHDYNLIY